MKVAISSEGKDLNSNVSEMFGRCPYLLIVEIKEGKTKKIEAMENIGANQMGGAGISAAQRVAEKDVNAVITGNIGPKGLDVLKQFGIEVYNGDGLVKEVLQNLIDGKLKKIQ